MAVFFSSSTVHSSLSARPSLLRTLVWAVGIQAALGGGLMMIHEQAFKGISETGIRIICVNFVDEEKNQKPAPLLKKRVMMLLHDPLPYGLENSKNPLNTSAIASEKITTPDEVAHVPECSELWLSNEDFGELILGKRRVSRTIKKSSIKGAKSSSLLASASSAEKATSAARYKTTPLPPYPRSARVEGREGVVMLKVLIDSEGNPETVSIAKSSGSLILDDVALDWVRKNWLFYPAINETGPVASTMIAPLRFKLNT